MQVHALDKVDAFDGVRLCKEDMVKLQNGDDVEFLKIYQRVGRRAKNLILKSTISLL